jgi:hypothetical protein
MHPSKTKPASSFDKQIEFHDFKERFFNIFLGKPHQIFLKDLSKDEVTEMDSKKELIA